MGNVQFADNVSFTYKNIFNPIHDKRNQITDILKILSDWKKSDSEIPLYW